MVYEPTQKNSYLFKTLFPEYQKTCYIHYHSCYMKYVIVISEILETSIIKFNNSPYVPIRMAKRSKVNDYGFECRRGVCVCVCLCVCVLAGKVSATFQ